MYFFKYNFKVKIKIMLSPEVDNRLKETEQKWLDIIKNLNSQFKTVPLLDNTLNEIYSKRQELCEYINSICLILSQIKRDFNKKRCVAYDKLKKGENGLRYSNDSAVYNQIDSLLIEDKEMLDRFEIHLEYLRDTRQTIDNMIYGINYKIKLYEFLNGVK